MNKLGLLFVFVVSFLSSTHRVSAQTAADNIIPANFQLVVSDTNVSKATKDLYTLAETPNAGAGSMTDPALQDLFGGTGAVGGLQQFDQLINDLANNTVNYAPNPSSGPAPGETFADITSQNLANMLTNDSTAPVEGSPGFPSGPGGVYDPTNPGGGFGPSPGAAIDNTIGGGPPPTLDLGLGPSVPGIGSPMDFLPKAPSFGNPGPPNDMFLGGGGPVPGPALGIGGTGNLISNTGILNPPPAQQPAPVQQRMSPTRMLVTMTALNPEFGEVLEQNPMLLPMTMMMENRQRQQEQQQQQAETAAPAPSTGGMFPNMGSSMLPGNAGAMMRQMQSMMRNPAVMNNMRRMANTLMQRLRNAQSTAGSTLPGAGSTMPSLASLLGGMTPAASNPTAPAPAPAAGGGMVDSLLSLLGPTPTVAGAGSPTIGAGSPTIGAGTGGGTGMTGANDMASLSSALMSAMGGGAPGGGALGGAANDPLLALLNPAAGTGGGGPLI